MKKESRTSGKTKTPQTKARDGAAEIVRKARAEGMSVDQYLRENAELYETEDGWNPDARKALKMESGDRFSVSQADQSFQKAPVNKEILEMIANVKKGNIVGQKPIYLGVVLPKVAAKIREIYNINVEGFKVFLEARQMQHILNDHGENGTSDQSMADDEVVARMQYVIQNAEEIKNGGTTTAYSEPGNGYSKSARTIRYEKSVGDKTYYLVQTAVDTKKKALYIVTAFIGKPGFEIKKETPQLANAQGPDTTPDNAHAVISKNRISQIAPNVNGTERNSYSSNKAAEVVEEDRSYPGTYEVNEAVADAEALVDQREAEAKAEKRAKQKAEREERMGCHSLPTCSIPPLFIRKNKSTPTGVLFAFGDP